MGKNEDTSKRFYVELSNRFDQLQHSTDYEEQWQLFGNAVRESAEATLGRRRGQTEKNDGLQVTHENSLMKGRMPSIHRTKLGTSNCKRQRRGI